MHTVEGASEGFKRRQRASFEGFAALELEDYSLTADWAALGDLVRPRANERYPGFDLVTIPVTVERYRLRGMDPAPASEDFYYTFGVSEGEWSIVSDSDLEDVGLYSARHLWDEGPVELFDSEHFTFISHPCSSDCVDIQEMAAQSERAYDRVRQYWDEIPDRTAVLVPNSTDELERMIQSTFDLDNFVAFAYSSEHPRLGYTGNRVMLNPDSFRGIDSEYAFQILAHEMLHIATRDAAGPFIPIFMDEGFADHVAYDAAPEGLGFFDAEVAAGRFEGALPHDYEFTTGDGTDIFRTYQESQSAVRFFIDRWGLDRFIQLYRRVGRPVTAAGTTRYWVDRTLRRTVDLNLKRFERRWADSIESR